MSTNGNDTDTGKKDEKWEQPTNNQINIAKRDNLGGVVTKNERPPNTIVNKQTTIETPAKQATRNNRWNVVTQQQEKQIPTNDQASTNFPSIN